MAKTRYQLQRESDARMGVQMRGYRLPVATVEEIARLAKARGMSQAAVITAAIAAFAAQDKDATT